MDNNIGKTLTNEIDKATHRPNPALLATGKIGIGGGLLGITAGFAFQAYGDCYKSGEFEKLPYGIGKCFVPLEVEGFKPIVA